MGVGVLFYFEKNHKTKKEIFMADLFKNTLVFYI